MATYEQLGQSEAEQSIQHGAKQGLHDATRDMVRLAVVGGTVVMIAALVLREEHLRRILERVRV